MKVFFQKLAWLENMFGMFLSRFYNKAVLQSTEKYLFGLHKLHISAVWCIEDGLSLTDLHALYMVSLKSNALIK